MGLSKSAVHLLLHTAAQHSFSGSVGTLGRQHVYVTAEEVNTLARKQGVALAPCVVALHREPTLRERGYLSDDSLFELLGFQRSVRIDHSDYEQAEERLDLNACQTPAHLMGTLDVLLDSGTIEHVFNLPQALAHCLKLVRMGGRIIHLSPSSNCVNHGFYSLSPTLFADFYRAAGCQLEALYLCRTPKQFTRQRWLVYDCQATDRNWLPLGRLDGAIWFTYAVARKDTQCQSVVPQQSMYESAWESARRLASDTDAGGGMHPRPVDDGENKPQEPAAGKAALLLNWTKPYPRLNRWAAGAIRLWRGWLGRWQELRSGHAPFPLIGKF